MDIYELFIHENDKRYDFNVIICSLHAPASTKTKSFKDFV